MPGLVFDDGPVPDPAEPLVGYFDEWLETLLARRSPRTAAGYVSDAAALASELCAVVGTPLPRVCADDAALRAVCASSAHDWLRHAGVGVASYVRARALCAALRLADLAPANLGRAYDRVGIGRADSSVGRIGSAWASLCALLVRRGVLAANPMHSPAVARPRGVRAEPAPLSYPEWNDGSKYGSKYGAPGPHGAACVAGPRRRAVRHVPGHRGAPRRAPAGNRRFSATSPAVRPERQRL